jgi:16S rRNA (adenine1518-N6/adenine1519-N6)-dimethyltransferase
MTPSASRAPLKRFGQHYLRDRNVIEKIVAAIDPRPEDALVEIGPGEGAITEPLLALVDRLVAVEIDRGAAAELRERFPSLDLIEGDVLETDLVALAERLGKPLRIAGNLPYNITSPILFKLFAARRLVSDATMMIQLEVAERIVSRRGVKSYGILSVLTRLFAEPRLLFKVSPHVFRPKPDVRSAVIRLDFRPATETPEDDAFLLRTVKAAFGTRRKTLKNALAGGGFGGVSLEGAPVDPTARAEELAPEEFRALANFLRTRTKDDYDG